MKRKQIYCQEKLIKVIAKSIKQEKIHPLELIEKSKILCVNHLIAKTGVVYKNLSHCGKIVPLRPSCPIGLDQLARIPQEFIITAENFDCLIPRIKKNDECAIIAAGKIAEYFLDNDKKMPKLVRKHIKECLYGKKGLKEDTKLKHKYRDHFIISAITWLTDPYMGINWTPFKKNEATCSERLSVLEIVQKALAVKGYNTSIANIERVWRDYKKNGGFDLIER